MALERGLSPVGLVQAWSVGYRVFLTVHSSPGHCPHPLGDCKAPRGTRLPLQGGLEKHGARRRGCRNSCIRLAWVVVNFCRLRFWRRSYFGEMQSRSHACHRCHYACDSAELRGVVQPWRWPLTHPGPGGVTLPCAGWSLAPLEVPQLRCLWPLLSGQLSIPKQLPRAGGRDDTCEIRTNRLNAWRRFALSTPLKSEPQSPRSLKDRPTLLPSSN